MSQANKSKASIEKVYQKKTPLEHVLLRPDTYIGSVEFVQQEMWVWDMDNDKMIKKEIKYVPGLFKIFDEILVNAADNKQRDPTMSVIKITISKEENMIKVHNNGKGIPVVEHKDEKIYVPSLIFGHLLTSSNYDDDEKKVTGGRNGYGAKLCNIFSKKFIVETSCHEYRKSFRQVWTNNMQDESKAQLKESKKDDFTCITFYPDLSKFKMDKLDDDICALLARRAYDVAASTRGVKVYLNDKLLPIKKFEDYCKLYIQSQQMNDELESLGMDQQMKLIYDCPNSRWEVAVYYSDLGFQQVSFVNSIATTKGGRHVDYICDQLVKHLCEVVNKKNKNGIQIKPFQIKNHLCLFVNCLIENPTFDSQTKETLTSQIKNFGSKCQLSEDFLKKVGKSVIVDRVLNWIAFKEKSVLESTGPKTKQSKIKGVAKLDDANNAGTKDSVNCTLILTEGDSAKSLAVAGLGVIGRDKYGVFPLRGKMLNVRESTMKQIVDNQEISSICRIVGLNFKEKYERYESLRQLRYGKIMIMTDQDHDGSHIKGLIINFIHHHWPNLLRHGFIEQFITPLVKVTSPRGDKEEKWFYSIPEFEEWQHNTANWSQFRVKYYKGLGTSTSKEAKEYFLNMSRHRINFRYDSIRDDLAIQLAFSKRFIEERKDWLTKYMNERRHLKDHNQTEKAYLYQKNTKQISFVDFINKELVLFSNMDNERSIPSLVDGFKPGQRKVLYTCFRRNLTKELKVAQLAGSVAELTAYHHGEQSLMSTIVNLAQNFVGSNNINLLMPVGQFGTRLHGGKDAASARYIFTCLSPLTRLLFNKKDDPLFEYLNDDGMYVEPEYYCPIIPMVLVNGADGIGTGWATKIPNYNPIDLIETLRAMIHSDEPNEVTNRRLRPFYKSFRGSIKSHPNDDIRVYVHGVVAILDDNMIEISELPVGVWTQVYKESVLEAFLYGSDSLKDKEKFQPLISDYKEYHTESTVRFVVRMSKEQFSNAERQGFHKYFKLEKTISLNSMVLFDANGCLKRYESVTEILKEFYEVRLGFYEKRKQYLEEQLKAECEKLSNLSRFIVEKCDGIIRIENYKKSEIIRILKQNNYASDPIRKWKENQLRNKSFISDEIALDMAVDTSGESTEMDYNYILSMPLWNLSLEKKDELLREKNRKMSELSELKAKSAKQLWLDDLDEFLREYKRHEETVGVESSKKQQQHTKQAKTIKNEYLPANDGELIEPVIESAQVGLNASMGSNKVNGLKEMNIVDLISGKYLNEIGEEVGLDESEIRTYAEQILKHKSMGSQRKAGVNTSRIKKEAKVIEESVTDKDETKVKAKSTVVRKKAESESNESDMEADALGVFDRKSVDSDVSFKLDSSNLNKREICRVRKPVKYKLESEDDEVSGFDSLSDGEESVPEPKAEIAAKKDDVKVKKPRKTPVKKPETPKSDTKKKAATARKRAKKAKTSDDDDDDDVSFSDCDEKPNGNSHRTTARARKTIVYNFDDDQSDSDSSSVITPVKKKKIVETSTPKPIAFANEDSDEEFAKIWQRTEMTPVSKTTESPAAKKKANQKLKLY